MASLSHTALGACSPVVQAFVQQAAALCMPLRIHVCTGTNAEHQDLLDVLEATGTITKLDQELRPGCYAARSDPKDVARSMADTYICSALQKDAGPTNNWMDPDVMRKALDESFKGSMEGKTMYVVPFCMGPYESPAAKFCVQVTDSPYVVVNLRITTRMGYQAMQKITAGTAFAECWHSVGCPIHERNAGTEAYAQARAAWPCDITRRRIVHFPEARRVMSFGSGYGGNALLGKKCIALRIATVQGRDEGWLAEHMLILGITNPEGAKRYICAAFPSACGKTNLAMLDASLALPGWRVETVGDDIAWLRLDDRGRLRAINPENGFFGVAPGTSVATNPNACKTFATNSLFTNVATTADGDVYWEGLAPLPTCGVTDWLGNPGWRPTLKADGSGEVDTTANPAAHPNSRFTTPLAQCPTVDSAWDSPEGVPIDAIVFGGRRDDTQPLVYETFGWEHGVFVGASMRSNATKAAEQNGLVHDPMANLPFIGCNIKDYFSNWLAMKGRAEAKEAVLPKVFHVNWFGKGEDGRFLWPGFADNARVLHWILARCDGRAGAIETPIGFLPEPGGIRLDGLEGVSAANMAKLLAVDARLWVQEAQAARTYFTETLMAGDSTPVPDALMDQLADLEDRLLRPRAPLGPSRGAPSGLRATAPNQLRAMCTRGRACYYACRCQHGYGSDGEPDDGAVASATTKPGPQGSTHNGISAICTDAMTLAGSTCTHGGQSGCIITPPVSVDTIITLPLPVNNKLIPITPPLSVDTGTGTGTTAHLPADTVVQTSAARAARAPPACEVRIPHIITVIPFFLSGATLTI